MELPTESPKPISKVGKHQRVGKNQNEDINNHINRYLIDKESNFYGIANSGCDFSDLHRVKKTLWQME